MTKAEMIASVADRAGLTRAEADSAIKGFTEAVTQALADGQKVPLVGFGTFSVGQRAARTGRNPQTGETIHIPARRTARFKASKALKDAM